MPTDGRLHRLRVAMTTVTFTDAWATIEYFYHRILSRFQLPSSICWSNNFCNQDLCYEKVILMSSKIVDMHLALKSLRFLVYDLTFNSHCSRKQSQCLAKMFKPLTTSLISLIYNFVNQTVSIHTFIWMNVNALFASQMELWHLTSGANWAILTSQTLTPCFNQLQTPMAGELLFR